MKRDPKLIVEAIRRSHTGDNPSQIAAKMAIPRSTIRGWLERFQQTGLDFNELKEQPMSAVEELFRPDHWQQTLAVEPDWDQILVSISAPNANTRDAYRLYKASIGLNQRPLSESTFYRRLNILRESAPKALKEKCLFNSFKKAEKAMIDYSGDGVAWYDRENKKNLTAQIFVGVLCYSRLIFCYATPKQTRLDWLRGITAMFDFFNGVTQEIWLDNSTSLVAKADKFDPKLSPEFENFCEHYDTIGYAVAPYKCRHKALVENAVGLCQRKILSEFVGRKFFSIDEINNAIKPLLEKLNQSELVSFPGQSRLSRYNEEKTALKPLPLIPFQPECVLYTRKVLTGNQIRIRKLRYNLPWGYVGKDVTVSENMMKGEIQVFLADTGEFLVASKIRGLAEGNEASKVELVPESFKPLLEDKAELLERINTEFGEKAYLVGQAIAKPNNNRSKRHLLGLLHIARQFSQTDLNEIMQKTLSSRSVITFASFKKVCEQYVNEHGSKNSRSIKRKASSGNSSDCDDFWGEDYYKGRFSHDTAKSIGAKNDGN